MAVMDDRGHPLSVFPANVKGLGKYTSKNLNRDQHDYSSHISKLPFPGRSVGVKAAAWVVMGHIYPSSGAGTKTRPLAERISLKSSDFDDVTPITLCTHSFPPNSPCIFLVFAFLSLLCMFACLSVTQSLSAPWSLQHFFLSLCLSHTLPHNVMLFLAKAVCWLMWVGVFVCVSLPCSLTLTITHVLFAEDEPRAPWRQRAGDTETKKGTGW